MPSVTCLEGAFCEANVLFLLALGSFDSGLVDDASVREASAVEGAGAEVFVWQCARSET